MLVSPKLLPLKAGSVEDDVYGPCTTPGVVYGYAFSMCWRCNQVQMYLLQFCEAVAAIVWLLSLSIFFSNALSSSQFSFNSSLLTGFVKLCIEFRGERLGQLSAMILF